MNRNFILRLALDGTAFGLFLLGLAYYWLDNVSHELAGTAMFLLVAVHNTVNRRWYGRIPRARRQARGRIDIALTTLLLVAMLVLLASSLMISRSLFGFVEGGFTARQVHMVAAYWVLLVLSIHLGMRWSMVIGAARAAFGLGMKSFVVLRILAVAIAACGLRSSFEMAFGSKLVLHYTLDMWDFNDSVAGFFLNMAAIAGLYVVLAHYATTWLRRQP